MEHDWVTLMLSFAHRPWLFDSGVCTGQQTPAKESSPKLSAGETASCIVSCSSDGNPPDYDYMSRYREQLRLAICEKYTSGPYVPGL